MIRRRLPDVPGLPARFALITQDDHARVAGVLASKLTGTACYPRPEPFDAFVAATTVHDAGWIEHDDPRRGFGPRLNQEGLPQDVFETTRDVAMRVWPGAPDAAAAHGPWAELLASLHILALSAYATSPTGFNHEKLDTSTLPARFAFNKFQHREIERQERLRTTLGLRRDLPLNMGLADEGVDAGEDRVRSLLRWLQAMDVCSLALCCTTPPMDRTQDVHARPGDGGEALSLRRVGDDLVVSPWVWPVERVEVTIPAVVVPARAYSSREELAGAMSAGERLEIRAEVRPY
jgi:hypothetical protein